MYTKTPSIFTMLTVLFVVILILQNRSAYESVLGADTQISESQILAITNRVRIDNNLAPLMLDSQLSQAAMSKALDMANNNYWSHISADGTKPWKFIVDSGYSYAYAGENLARNFMTSDEVVEAWMNSPGHKENLLSADYADVGIVMLTKENGKNIIVQILATKGTSNKIYYSTEVVNDNLIPAKLSLAGIIIVIGFLNLLRVKKRYTN